jgi:hypothetical protein
MARVAGRRIHQSYPSVRRHVRGRRRCLYAGALCAASWRAGAGRHAAAQGRTWSRVAKATRREEEDGVNFGQRRRPMEGAGAPGTARPGVGEEMEHGSLFAATDAGVRSLLV